jgi:hypothetical protein
LEILVFYRREKYEFPNAGFRYEGPFEYVSHRGTSPAHFTLRRTIQQPEAQERGLQEEAAEGAVAFLERRAAKAAGQGFVSSPERRKAVERHAMAAARRYLEEIGFDIEDTSAERPYDLIARRPGEEIFVEIKGTTGSGEEIILTSNEVEHASAQGRCCMLFILSEVVVVEGTGGPTASGGTRHVLWPWDLETEALSAISYKYRVSGTRRAGDDAAPNSPGPLTHGVFAVRREGCRGPGDGSSNSLQHGRDLTGEPVHP